MAKKILYTKFSDIPQFTRSGNYQVNVSWPYLEDHLAHWSERGNLLELNPDFQRGHVWDEAKKAAYVQYILRGGKSSRVLYFNCSSWQNGYDTPIELVDGKQRLDAVRAFLRNEIPVFGGSYFRDFTDRLAGMCGPDFIFTVNDLKTRAEVLQWYLDLNTGGVVHTDDEINRVKKLLDAELHI